MLGNIMDRYFKAALFDKWEALKIMITRRFDYDKGRQQKDITTEGRLWDELS